jgi:hypothetical protein
MDEVIEKDFLVYKAIITDSYVVPVGRFGHYSLPIKAPPGDTSAPRPPPSSLSCIYFRLARNNSTNQLALKMLQASRLAQLVRAWC